MRFAAAENSAASTPLMVSDPVSVDAHVTR